MANSHCKLPTIPLLFLQLRLTTIGFNRAKNQHAALSNEYVVVESATQKTKATGKKRKAAASAKKASKKMKREDEPVEPVVDVSIIKASPTTLASKLFSVLMFYAIPFPSMASLHQLVATKARPDIMHALVQEMVFCFVAAHSPQAQIRNRLSFNVPNRDAAKVDVPPGLLEADYDSKVQWVARQIKASQNQTERLNILESYYHDFIKVEAHTQDRGKATRPLSKHAVAKDFALQIGIRGISDTNVTKYEYLWAMLSHLRAAGIQSLVLYRNGTMNTLLRNEIFRPADSRLRVSEVEEWGTLVEEIATHLQVSCTIDVEMTWPAYRWRFLAEKIQFEGDCINEFLANATPKATHLDAYGFKGYSDLNRSWALMIPSVGPARPLAITAIEEKSYLGIMPGKIRFGGVCSPSAIVGPGGLWLDLEGEEACLAKIPETTSIDQCNVNVAWEYTEDEMVLGSMGVRVLVFASRKIEIFQEVWRLRW